MAEVLAEVLVMTGFFGGLFALAAILGRAETSWRRHRREQDTDHDL